MTAVTSQDEDVRLHILREYQILDTSPEIAFERLTSLAARIFKVPIALISLVDADRQWFKSCFGMDVRQTDRQLSFCAHAILSDEVMVVPDAATDPRFSNNALVTGPPHIRFYAGAPLKTSEGQNLGSLCVIDTKPREFSAEQQ
ncbi:MAG: GAF domain-containing protein, partial [Proteobacteria bacterium]